MTTSADPQQVIGTRFTDLFATVFMGLEFPTQDWFDSWDVPLHAVITECEYIEGVPAT